MTDKARRRVDRMARAREKYGPLDLSKDMRDLFREAAEENVDRAFYRDALYIALQVPARPFVHRRRRPCPTGMPGSLDGVVPSQPSRCATSCTCCAWCRGEAPAYGKMNERNHVRGWCTCPSPIAPESNCERGHSALVECRGGCKPRPLATAVVVRRGPWGESLLVKVWSVIRSVIRSLTRWRAS